MSERARRRRAPLCAASGWLAICVTFGLATACTHRDGTPSTSGDRVGDTSVDDDPTTSQTSCDVAPTVFDALDWVPADATLAALSDAAQGEEALTEFERLLTATEGTPLSGDVRLGLAGLGFERRLVADTYARMGVSARQLLKLHSPEGVTSWVALSQCPLESLRDRVRAAWGLDLREDVGGYRAPAGPEARLPFDILVLPGGRVLLSARGSGVATLAWLARAQAEPADGATGALRTVGRLVLDEADAPWRIVTQGEFASAGEPTISAWRVVSGVRTRVELDSAAPRGAPEP